MHRGNTEITRRRICASHYASPQHAFGLDAGIACSTYKNAGAEPAFPLEDTAICILGLNRRYPKK